MKKKNPHLRKDRRLGSIRIFQLNRDLEEASFVIRRNDTQRALDYCRRVDIELEMDLDTGSKVAICRIM